MWGEIQIGVREREKGTEKGPALGSGRILRKGKKKQKEKKQKKQAATGIYIRGEETHFDIERKEEYLQQGC